MTELVDCDAYTREELIQLMLSICNVCRFPAGLHRRQASAVALPTALAAIGGTCVNDFSSFWTTLLNGNIIEDQTNSRLWTLPNGTPWMGNVITFYNRECYDTIIHDIFEDKLTHALILGTPGIGKTMFLQRLLVELVRRARLKRDDPPSIHYLRSTYTGNVQRLSFLQNGLVMDITGIKDNVDPDYLLSDSVDLHASCGKLLNLEVASDKDANFNIFQKSMRSVQTPNKEIVMDIFSFDELLCIQPSTMDDEVAKLRYYVYGGSARNFMGLTRVNSSILPVVWDTMRLMFSDTDDNILQIVAMDVSAKLLAARDPNFQTVNSMMRHIPPDRVPIWASRFMEFLAAGILECQNLGIVHELKRMIGEGGLGCLFEARGHRKLLLSGVSFLLKPLLKQMPEDKPLFESMTFDLSVVRFRTIEEISKLPEGHYGLPMTNNFPLIDAIIQPNILIQFTTSPRDHKGSTASLAAIRDALHEKNPIKHRMVFVIPRENISTFRFCSGLADICQFMCTDEPSVEGEASLMTDIEKAKWTVQTIKRQKAGSS